MSSSPGYVKKRRTPILETPSSCGSQRGLVWAHGIGLCVRGERRRSHSLNGGLAETPSPSRRRLATQVGGRAQSVKQMPAKGEGFMTRGVVRHGIRVANRRGGAGQIY